MRRGIVEQGVVLVEVGGHGGYRASSVTEERCGFRVGDKFAYFLECDPGGDSRASVRAHVGSPAVAIGNDGHVETYCGVVITQ